MLFLTLVLIQCLFSNTFSEGNTPLPKFPWSDNVPQLEFSTSKPNTTLTRSVLVEEVKRGRIPKELKPYLNMTRVEEMKKENNETLDFVITDEDVADIPDDDEDPNRKLNTLTHDGNKTIITVSEEAKEDLYKHWLDQSLSGLMGAVVTNVINKRKMTKKEKYAHYNCTQAAKNVTAHAKCVVAVYDLVKKRNEKLKMYSDLSKRVHIQRRDKDDSWKHPLDGYDKFVKSGAEEFRVKRAVNYGLLDEYERQKKIQVKTQKSYELREAKNLSPMALIARRLTEIVRAAKNTTDPPKRWQQVIAEIKEETGRIKKKKRSKERMKRKFTRFIDTMKGTGLNPSRALHSMGMEDLFEDDPILSEKEQDKQDREEMLATMKPEDKMLHEPIKLIREGIKLGMMVGGRNVSDFDDKKVAFLSPQFMSILPDEVANDTVSLFSPSILSLHGEGSDLDRQLSLTRALKLMEDTGQDEWMNFVLEASGVTETIDKMRQAEQKEEIEEIQRDFVSKDGQPLWFTKENVTEIYGDEEASKLDFFDKFYKTMTDEQMKDMNTTGYSIMSNEQLEEMYGKKSPYRDDEALDRLSKVDHRDMPELIEDNIRGLAKNDYKFEMSRRKDIVLSPLLLMSLVADPVTASQSIILSPVVLTPLILSPSIYGNVILSPWVFVPVIVSPRILGAVVLSPVVFSPVVLSPLCMTPVILSPSVGLPIILSPFVLTPFILSPTVMAPLVLSPFCLSPFIGIPNVLTPLILSPFVLSPLILSPPFVSAFVLSPYALSPPVLSNGALFTAVLSPKGNTPLPKFPWSDNVPQLEFSTSKPNTTLTRSVLVEEVKRGRIPKELKPFLNMTLVEGMKKKNNETLDFVITDEDVADIPDDDENPNRKLNTLTHDGNKTIITISDEAKEDLYKHWLDQSLSGLMGAVVTSVINKRKMTKKEKYAHYNCTQAAKNVTAHAKCVVAVYDLVKKRNEKLKMYSDLSKRVHIQRRDKDDSWKHTLNGYDEFVKSGAEEFRVKRAVNFGLLDEYERQKKIHVETKKSYKLREANKPPLMALIAQKLTKIVRTAKNKTDPPKGWQQVIAEIKEETKRIKKKKRNKDRMKRKFTRFIDTMKGTGLNPNRALRSMGMDDLFEDDPILSEKEQDKQDREEMLATMKPEDKMLHEPIKLIREGIKLGMMVGGRNVSDFDDKKVALLSPQFMSILPDEVANDTVSLLSPSILSLHGEGSELDKQLSLKKALKLMEDTGQDEWMNFVLEASGVTETIDKIKKAEETEETRNNFVSEEGQPLYFTKENITEMYGEEEASKLDFFDKFYKTMTDEQMKDMNTTGYSIMSNEQLEEMYGKKSPYRDDEALDRLSKVDHRDMPDLIEDNIRGLAKNDYKFEMSRRKDIVLNPVILLSIVLDPVTASQSIVLSPVILTPLILSPSIYGNVILSPWVFVPIIVAPRILGAVVLSPVVFSPVVLSPLCLVPVILSPVVGSPIILSPFVLSPFILSPTVMNPLILSPFCLSPFIGVPNVLTPLILSPFVLSPLILSPPYVSAFVLSPYALSPAVLSDGALFTAVLSPSRWFSMCEFMLSILLVIASSLFSNIVSENVTSPNHTPLPKFPWSDNIPTLEFSTSKPNTKLTRSVLIEEVKRGRIPKELKPYLNMTRVEEMKKENNETLDFVITDEDVADIPDDDEDPYRKVNTLTHDGNKTVITISDEAKDDLYKHWLDQSLSGLMGAVVTNVINKRKMTKKEKYAHYNCTQAAKNVTAHAKCVVAVYDLVKKRNEKLKMYSDLSKRVHIQRRDKDDSWKHTLNGYDKFAKSGAEEFRVKRAVNFGLLDEYERQKKIQVQSQKSYQIREAKNLSPMALIARRLTEIVRAAKNTTDPPKRWQQVIAEIKEETGRIKKKKRSKDRMKRKFSKFVDTIKGTGLNPNRALRSMGMEDLFEDDPILSEKEEEKQYREDMLATMKPEDKMLHEPIKLIREGIKLGMMVGGRNVSDFDDKKVALLSPQFMSILPDEVANDTVSLFSPSILALHGEGTELERKLSLTRALKLIEDTGQDEWMNFVLEASGVTETIDKMRQAEQKEEIEELRRDYVSKEGQPLYFTKENITEMYGEEEASKLDFFDKFYKTMTDEQMKDMNTTGYSIMSNEQLEEMYGKKSPYRDDEALDRLSKVDHRDMPDLIEDNIRSLAKHNYKFEMSRSKDFVLTPLVLMSLVGDPAAASQGIILSPVLLTPLILSPSIYGNVILSPWVFVPIIVSPRILGAVVLSPVVFSPLVLSPLCMTPVILSPSVGLPIILSPFVLTPFILSPTVMTPLVLSPFCLSPFIGVPNALTPIILSPFVLSPLILSPPFVSAFVLSPYALSPPVLSSGALFTAVLSPSWLSTL